MPSDAYIPIDALSEPAFLVSDDGVIQAVNRSFAKQLALTKQALIDRNLSELCIQAGDSVLGYLQSCARTSERTVGALKFPAPGDGTLVFKAYGCLLRPRNDERRAEILIRLTPRSEGSHEFILLQQQIEDLNREIRAGSVRLDTQRAEISGACQFLLCPELSTAAVGRRLHDERPIAAVGNSHALRVV